MENKAGELGLPLQLVRKRNANQLNMNALFVSCESLSAIANILAPIRDVPLLGSHIRPVKAFRKLIRRFRKHEQLENRMPLPATVECLLKASYELFVHEGCVRCDVREYSKILSRMYTITRSLKDKVRCLAGGSENEFRQKFTKVDLCFFVFFENVEIHANALMNSKIVSHDESNDQVGSHLRRIIDECYQAVRIFRKKAVKIDKHAHQLRTLSWAADVWEVINNLGGPSMEIPAENSPQECVGCRRTYTDPRKMRVTGCCGYFCVDCMRVFRHAKLKCTVCKRLIRGWTTVDEIQKLWRLQKDNLKYESGNKIRENELITSHGKENKRNKRW